MYVPSATLGDYDEEEHKAGYTAEFDDFHLIPKDNRVSAIDITSSLHHQWNL